MNTAQKIALARWLFRLVRAGRLATGRRGTEVVCRRRGVRWSLDLREGVQLALYLGVYERETARRLLESVTPGAIVIDVGANVGAHTLPLARAAGATGRVVAVEPTDTAFARLTANCALNPELRDRITAVHAALGAPGGAAAPRYYSAWPVSPQGTQHPVHLGAEQPATQAAFFTLDDLVASLRLPRVSLIKIDVDGGELEVLQGAAGVIAAHRPVVVFELCPYLLDERRQSPRQVIEYFTGQGYELVDERTLQPIGTDAARWLASIPQGGGRNLIARSRA